MCGNKGHFRRSSLCPRYGSNHQRGYRSRGFRGRGYRVNCVDDYGGYDDYDDRYGEPDERTPENHDCNDVEMTDMCGALYAEVTESNVYEVNISNVYDAEFHVTLNIVNSNEQLSLELDTGQSVMFLVCLHCKDCGMLSMLLSPVLCISVVCMVKRLDL